MSSLSSLHRHKKFSEWYVPLEGPYCHITVVLHDCWATGTEALLFRIHVICDMLHQWASCSQHFKEMENNYLLDLEDEGHMFRTNCPTMQCPFQKTGILNYATEKTSKLVAIYIVEQQSFQSLDNLTNSTTSAGQGKNHLNSINNGDSKSKQDDDNQSERSSHNMPSKHRQGAEDGSIHSVTLALK
jgi:hypothetical protein